MQTLNGYACLPLELIAEGYFVKLKLKSEIKGRGIITCLNSVDSLEELDHNSPASIVILDVEDKFGVYPSEILFKLLDKVGNTMKSILYSKTKFFLEVPKFENSFDMSIGTVWVKSSLS